jgi:hypothetical protein
MDAHCELPRVWPLVRDIEDVLLLDWLVAFLEGAEYWLAVMLFVLVDGSDGLVVKRQLGDVTTRRLFSILPCLLDHPRRETLVNHVECDLGGLVKQANLIDG